MPFELQMLCTGKIEVQLWLDFRRLFTCFSRLDVSQKIKNAPSKDKLAVLTIILKHNLAKTSQLYVLKGKIKLSHGNSFANMIRVQLN